MYFSAKFKRQSIREIFLSLFFFIPTRIFNVIEFLTFHLLHARELSLPEIVERMGGRRLEIHPVLSQTGARRITACAHARMISKPSLIQIRMRQGVHHGDPFVLQ